MVPPHHRRPPEPWQTGRPEVFRFLRLVAKDVLFVQLDRACFQISAACHPDLEMDIDQQLARLDALAAAVPDKTLDGLIDHLCRVEMFLGDTETYGAAENSYLDVVLDRHRGIPITLSILMMEVGRRIGVPLEGVGLPGHFLLRDGNDPGVFIDPFSGGVRLDADGCRRIHEHLSDGTMPFDPRWLDPVEPRAILARVLANLKRGARARGDRTTLAVASRLRSLIFGMPISELREFGEMLAAMGRFDQAAEELHWAASAAEAEDARGEPPTLGADPKELRQRANRLKATLN